LISTTRAYTARKRAHWKKPAGESERGNAWHPPGLPGHAFGAPLIHRVEARPFWRDSDDGKNKNRIGGRRIKASQYARIALVEKLCREQFMQHPGLAHLEKSAAIQAAE
jgi:hypothetical protein